jgi:hypothetical protein
MSDSLPELWDIDRVCAYRRNVPNPIAAAGHERPVNRLGDAAPGQGSRTAAKHNQAGGMTWQEPGLTPW